MHRSSRLAPGRTQGGDGPDFTRAAGCARGTIAACTSTLLPHVWRPPLGQHWRPAPRPPPRDALPRTPTPRAIAAALQAVAEQHFPKLDNPTGMSLDVQDAQGKTYTLRWR